MFTYVYHCLLVFHVFSCLPMFTLAYQSSSLFTRVYLCLFVLGNLCLPKFTRVYLCLLVLDNMFCQVYRVSPCLVAFSCLPMFTHVHLCLPLFTHAGLHMFIHLYLGLPTLYPCLFFRYV